MPDGSVLFFAYSYFLPVGCGQCKVKGGVFLINIVKTALENEYSASKCGLTEGDPPLNLIKTTRKDR
jgi:hypothetical protein